MDLYTMNEYFIAQETVDEFLSAIWTERYFGGGDVTLVVPATSEMITRLQEGTFLGLRGSRETMIVETQSIEDEKLTVLGRTLDAFLDSRFLWTKNPDSSSAENRIADYTETGKPGQVIANVVEDMVINPVAFAGDYVDANLDWAREIIPDLELGAIDTSGDDERITVPVGPLYSSIRQVAEKYGVGFSLYVHSVSIDTGYVLKFTTYQGIDRTSDQTTYPLVRLQPDMDSLSDIKELRSLAHYKNVAYVYYQGEITTHYPEDVVTPPEGFERRIIVTNAEGEPLGRKVSGRSPLSRWWDTEYSGYTVGPAEIAAFRAQHAKDVLANHNYIRAVDGQTSPTNDYTFGVDYFLGDIIELEGLTGAIAKARVTEYIRSQDKTGEREYPTISVIS